MDLFSKVGQVKNVKFSTDEDENIEESSTPKVVWYIEFYDDVSVPMARALLGRPAFRQALVVVKKLVESKSRARVSATETYTRTSSRTSCVLCKRRAFFYDLALSTIFYSNQILRMLNFVRVKLQRKHYVSIRHYM